MKFDTISPMGTSLVRWVVYPRTVRGSRVRRSPTSELIGHGRSGAAPRDTDVISGTSTISGTYSFSAQVTDSSTSTGTARRRCRSRLPTVGFRITTSNLPNVTLGVPYPSPSCRRTGRARSVEGDVGGNLGRGIPVAVDRHSFRQPRGTRPRVNAPASSSASSLAPGKPVHGLPRPPCGEPDGRVDAGVHECHPQLADHERRTDANALPLDPPGADHALRRARCGRTRDDGLPPCGGTGSTRRGTDQSAGVLQRASGGDRGSPRRPTPSPAGAPRSWRVNGSACRG